MPKTAFIQVILPLRLEWEPWYSLEDAAVGDRVSVSLAGRAYTGVVSAVDVVPDPSVKVLPATRLDLPPVQEKEIAFWRALASYYLCTVGEVYKAAYPEIIRKGKEREPARQPAEEPLPIALPEYGEKTLEQIQAAFSRKKTVLLSGNANKTELYLELARRCMQGGRSVLWLVPEIGLSRQLETRIRASFPALLVYHSGRTVARRKDVVSAVRGPEPCLVLGTRSALFLPHRQLGLIVVDQEHDVSYKQDAPTPRYHARESAILLAGVHGASVLLGSGTPSLESLYNAETGLFEKVEVNEHFSRGKAPQFTLINTAAEIRKNGMAGSFSLKLLDALHRALDAGQPALVICRSKDAIEECEAELARIFPGKDIRTATPASFKTLATGTFACIGILKADGLLGKDDFRSDEHTLQFLQQLQARCRAGGELVVQTMEAGHPVFKAFREGLDARAFLPERQVAGYPPYTRLVQVVLRDRNPKRLDYLARELAAALPRNLQAMGPYAPELDAQQRLIRITLPRDKSLRSRKTALAAAVSAFEKTRKYTGHIALDVDPL